MRSTALRRNRAIELLTIANKTQCKVRICPVRFQESQCVVKKDKPFIRGLATNSICKDLDLLSRNITGQGMRLT
jgi:hypothetical protein